MRFFLFYFRFYWFLFAAFFRFHFIHKTLTQCIYGLKFKTIVKHTVYSVSFACIWVIQCINGMNELLLATLCAAVKQYATSFNKTTTNCNIYTTHTHISIPNSYNKINGKNCQWTFSTNNLRFWHFSSRYTILLLCMWILCMYCTYYIVFAHIFCCKYCRLEWWCWMLALIHTTQLPAQWCWHTQYGCKPSWPQNMNNNNSLWCFFRKGNSK